MPGGVGAAVIPTSPKVAASSSSSMFSMKLRMRWRIQPPADQPIRTQQWNLGLDSDILRHGVISSGGANRRVLRAN